MKSANITFTASAEITEVIRSRWKSSEKIRLLERTLEIARLGTMRNTGSREKKPDTLHYRHAEITKMAEEAIIFRWPKLCET